MREIPLRNGGVALVDDEDYERISRFRWHRTPRGYAERVEYVRPGKTRHIHMHRVINGTPDDLETDHRDGNPLNNCRANLRSATRSQNCANSARTSRARGRFRGVYFRRDLKRRPWRAHISVNGELRYLGFFETEEAAARAYDAAAIEVFGEFARPNFPSEARVAV